MKRTFLLLIFATLGLLIIAQTGDDYFEKNDFHNAALRYEKEVKTNPEKYLNLAKSYFALKEFEKAIEALETYKEKYSGADKEYVNKFLELLKRDDDYVEVINVGGVINTDKVEAVPRISEDGKTLYFKSSDRLGGEGGEDIWYSKKAEDGTWMAPVSFSDLNTDSHEALYSISGGGNVAILFGNYEGSFGNGDLFYSVKTKDGWTMPCNLGGTINTNKWESQACLASDGKTLFFVNSWSGGQGEADIYVTELTENGWTTPINLGPMVNTAGDENRPFLAADGKTLYFSSDGHFCFGGSDIFVTKKIGDSWTNWSKPVNLGKYINTLDDDEDLSVPASGIKGYTVKYNLIDGYGDYDIYEFVLPPSMRPERVFKVYGNVFDEEDNAVGAIIKYIDVETGNEKAKAVSDIEDGTYEVSLPPLRKYEVIIDMKGYLYYNEILDLSNPDLYKTEATLMEKLQSELSRIKNAREKFDQYNSELDVLLESNSTDIIEGFKQYENMAEKYRINAKNLDLAIKRAKLEWMSEEDDELSLQRDYHLQTIKVGAKFELENIFFDFGKATLKEESKNSLDKLYDIMNRSEIVIELGGHTDNVGSDEANLQLSQDRVNSVRQYLIEKGISELRIAAVGYGEQYPIASNETDEGRAKNRRVEVQITDLHVREGGDVLSEEDLRKKEEVEVKFDFLTALRDASKIGGLPAGSPCGDEVVYKPQPKKEPKPAKTYKTDVPVMDLDNYVYKRFNAHLLNYGYKPSVLKGMDWGAGINFVKEKGETFREFHGEYYFKTADSLKLHFGLGWLWAWKWNDVVYQPIAVLIGIDGNFIGLDKDYADAHNLKTIGYLNIPLGLRYIYEYNDIIIGPEIVYNFGTNKVKVYDDGEEVSLKTSYFSIGANARWKFVQGGVHYNMGKFVNYFGLRAGLAF
ncbi:MAG: OmpA family protein [Bacteroidales bacterium]|nr:OmpA family protein [Bacteroidales bacterium]